VLCRAGSGERRDQAAGHDADHPDHSGRSRLPQHGGVVTHLLKVRVPDVDAACARARDFGARVLGEPTTYEYGERSCVVEDLGGHRWELTQSVRDVEPEEWGGVTVAPW